MKAQKKELSGPDRMLASKRKCIERARKEIIAIRQDAEEKVAKIESKIRVDAAIVTVLEKGMLRP